MGIHPGEPKRPTFCAKHFFERLRIASTKTFIVEDEKREEELLYLLIFVVLEVKYDLDRTGMKI